MTSLKNKILFFLFLSVLYSCSEEGSKQAFIDSEIEKYLSSMSIEEKVGQIFMIEISHISPEEVRDYKIGAILNGGGSFPYGKADHGLEDWQNLADEYFLASKNGGNGSGIPVIWGTDAVHGHNNLKGAVLYPHNIGLGATRNLELIKTLSSAVAKEVYLSGLDMTFAPAVSVPLDDRWGRTYEGFSEDPSLVAKMGRASVEGYQGELGKNYLDKGKVLATAKHYIGDGGTLNGVDKGNTVLDETDLLELHGQGYQTTIDAGVEFIMASFNSWNGQKLHGHKYLLTDVLKDRLGFQGVVLGDWNGHQEVDGCHSYTCPEAINAGLDMFMVTDSWKKLYENTLEQVKSGQISLERLNDAVSRILRVKILYGLFAKEKPSERQFNFINDSIGSKEHRDIARQAVRESLVLLKNNENILPLDPDSTILVVGKGSRDISKASGGWSFTWQGTGNTNNNFPGSTTIYEGIEDFVLKAGGNVSYSSDGSYSEKPDSAIIVVGENPYAEYQGSVENLAFENNEIDHLKIAHSLRKDGISVTYIFLSGRPLWVNKELNSSDAFVAAWLPGTEGDGIAEVIFAQTIEGNPVDFKGKLPFSWPKTINQTNLNFWDADYDPLFEYGYGLTYLEQSNLGQLNENDQFTKKLKLGDVLLQGWPSPKFKVYVGFLNKTFELEGKSIGSPNGEVFVQIVDGKLQEDAHRVALNVGSSKWYLEPTEIMNLEEEEKASGILTFDFKINKQDSINPLYYLVDCGENCDVELDLTTFINTLQVERWQTLGIPLKCLKERGVDLKYIESPIGFTSKGTWEFEVGKVYLEGGEGGKSIFPCK